MSLPLATSSRTSTACGHTVKRLPIGPTSKPLGEASRKRREGVIFSHSPSSSITSLQSTTSMSTSSSSSRVPSPALYATPSPTPSDCSFNISPRPIHIPLPGYSTCARSRPTLTIKVPCNEDSYWGGIVESGMPPHVIQPASAVSPTTSSPLSPLVFAHPKPHAPLLVQQQRKKKLDKLRRTFGENVPTDLVFSSSDSISSAGLPHDPVSPLCARPCASAKDVKNKGWGVFKPGKTAVFKQSLFNRKSNTGMRSPRIGQTCLSSGSTATVDDDNRLPWSGRDSSPSYTERVFAQGHPEQSRPLHRMQSWHGGWNLGDMDQVKAALRALKA